MKFGGVARLLGLAPALHAVYRGVDCHDVLFDLLPGGSSVCGCGGDGAVVGNVVRRDLGAGGFLSLLRIGGRLSHLHSALVFPQSFLVVCRSFHNSNFFVPRAKVIP